MSLGMNLKLLKEISHGCNCQKRCTCGLYFLKFFSPLLPLGTISDKKKKPRCGTNLSLASERLYGTFCINETHCPSRKPDVDSVTARINFWGIMSMFTYMLQLKLSFHQTFPFCDYQCRKKEALWIHRGKNYSINQLYTHYWGVICNYIQP